jgi:transposase InsO family protein
MASNAIGSVEDAVMRTFIGDVPEDLFLKVDNVPQYQPGNFRRAMKPLGMKLDYMQKHTPEDNGNIESFHNSIKTDHIWSNEFADIYEALKMVEYAFNHYNQTRPHSSVMYLPLSEFRRRWESGEEFRVE